METDRRGFFQILGSVLAFLSGGAAARSPELAPEIHLATRNNRFGAIGPKRPRGKRGPPFKLYPKAARIALPAAEEVGRNFAEVVRSYSPARGFVPAPLSVGEFAKLLYFTNGVTGPSPGRRSSAHLRAAPSAGALYAGEVYVAAEQVDGLASGLYYYAAAEHQLLQLREGSLLVEVGRSLERPAEIENAAAVVLLTNVFGRYTRRYANRGYRYALIDSGHIGENLRLAASSFGLADSSALRFCDDRLNDLLGIDGESEAVCAIHAIGRGGAHSDRDPTGERRFTEMQFNGWTAPDIPVIERFHQATKLVPDTGRSSANRVSPRTDSDPSDERGLKLPKSQPSEVSVATAIRERRSAKEFTRPAVTLGDLSFVLEAADGNPALRRAAGVQIFAVAHRVAGLESGIYRYAPMRHELIPIRKADLHRSLVGACLGQEKAGSAAVGFAMAARLEAAPSLLGDRRYRDLLLESGAIAQRIYLAAEVAGLVARNLAAFVDDRFNELLDLDSRDLSALHLTMLGHGR